MQLIKSGATEPIPVFVTDSTGAPVLAVAAGSFTITVRRPGASAYVAALGTILESGNGVYDYTPTTAETTIAGSKNVLLAHVVVTATATSFGDSSAQIVAFDPTDAAALGLSRIDQTIGSRSTFAGGAVSSVTGAVGSVAGNVGGSVAGSVASITSTVTLSTADEAILAKLTAMTNGTPAFTAPALALAPIGGSAPTVTAIRQEIDTNSTQLAAIAAKTTNLPVAPAAVGSVMKLDLTQAIPTTNTAQTTGDALNAARAQGFGKWAVVGTTLNIYAADGTTIVRAFTLDSATAPTSRS
jgi:hypothetical protein